jgi:serine/threonine protein kinase
LVHEAQFAENRLFKASADDADYPGEWGALLYIHRGADAASPEATAPRALSEVAYARERKFSTPKLRRALGEVVTKLKNAHEASAFQRVDLRAHLRPYLRRGKALPRVRCILGSECDKEKVRLLGASVTNPLKYIKRFPKDTELLVGRVHGDLHPDNIILDRSNVPHLIDFAWAKQPRNVLVDFVLLETSLRFMAFPRPMGFQEQLGVDRLLLRECGADDIPSMRFCTRESAHSYNLNYAYDQRPERWSRSADADRS